MEPKLVKLFCRIKCDPDSELCENIWLAINLRQERAARIKLWCFSAVGLISLMALVPAFIKLSGDFARSGFFDYFSLLSPGISYDGSVFFYWRELAWSLLESLPAVSIILSLTLIFIFFLSLRYAVKQIKSAPKMLGVV